MGPIPGTRQPLSIAGLLAATITLATLVGCAQPEPAAEPARVAAAANLQVALTDIADQFTRDTGERVDLVFGSSGLLTRQIQEGAPFDMFLSADEESVARLNDAGLTRDAGVPYAIGRIAFFAPRGGPFRPADGFEGLRGLMTAGQVPAFAIANPEHAPYGRAAAEALRTHGLWEAIRPSLVMGENVAQAAQFATTGNAIGGIVAYSLVRTPALRERGEYALIDQADHAPLAQRMVLVKGAGAVASRFYDYLQTDATRAVLDRHGFTPPVR
jgi:molybdate transport system substrate-binding protein